MADESYGLEERTVYLHGARVVVDAQGRLVRSGAAGRPDGSGFFGEPTVRLSVPVSLVPVIQSLLCVMRRGQLARARCLRSVLVADPELTGDLARILQGDYDGVAFDEELEAVGSGPGAV